MAFSRYTRDDIIKAGTSFGTATGAEAIKDAVNDGTLEVETRLIEEAERIAYQKSMKGMVAISGFGVRGYYKKFNYNW